MFPCNPKVESSGHSAVNLCEHPWWRSFRKLIWALWHHVPFTVSFSVLFSHCQGQFVQTMQYGGHWYGLSRETIERVAREGFACCVHMELEVQCGIKKTCSIMLNKHKTGSNATAVNYAGRFCVFVPIQGVYSLKNSYFEPRYVLLIPTVVDNYVCSLKAEDSTATLRWKQPCLVLICMPKSTENHLASLTTSSLVVTNFY